jgi:hypothetical protein
VTGRSTDDEGDEGRSDADGEDDADGLDGVADVTVTDLRVEYEREPNDVPPDGPRFSWRAETDGRRAVQTAYRVLVARSEAALADGRGDCWDSGLVERPHSTNVDYDGVPLEPGTDYHWTARVRDGDGDLSAWAGPTQFSTALGDGRDWEGRWIGYRPAGGDSNGYRSAWHPGGEDANADVEEWFYYALAGLRFDDSMHGRGSVAVAPAVVDDLDWAAGRVETVNGPFASRWERTDDGVAFAVEIPWNATGTVRLPVDPARATVVEGDDEDGGEQVTVREAGAGRSLSDGVGTVAAGDGAVVLTVGSGSYRLAVRE